MKPAEWFKVNEKVTFRLSAGETGESYTCLVKKIKDNLVAVVISNRDKQRLRLSVSDDIYLFKEWDGEYWVIPSELKQRQSYPLIVLALSEEPRLLSPVHELEGMTTPAPMDEIELIDSDHMMGVPEVSEAPEPEKPGVSLAKKPMESWEEEPVAMEDMSESLDEMTGITIRELQNEPATMERKETPSVPAMALDDLQEIDTSELAGSLEEDINVTRSKTEDDFYSVKSKRGAGMLSQSDDELMDMEMIEDHSVDLGELDTSVFPASAPPPGADYEEEDITTYGAIDIDETGYTPPVMEAPEMAEPMDMEPPPASMEDIAKALEEAEAFMPGEGEPEEDWRVTRLDEEKEEEEEQERTEDETAVYIPYEEAPVYRPDDELADTAITREELIPAAFHDFFPVSLSIGAQEDSSEHYEIAEIIAGLDPLTEMAFTKVLERLAQVEGVVSRFTGESIGEEAPSVETETIAAVCVKLTVDEIKVALDRNLEPGGRLTVSVDRPWRPSLRFTAEAEVDFCAEISGQHMARLRFIGLSDEAMASIAGYLENGGEYFRLLSAISDD